MRTVAKDIDKSGLEAMPDALEVYRPKARSCAVIARLAEVGLPQPGEQFRLVTRRNFNSIEMLEYIASREKVVRLYAAVYSINERAAVSLCNLLDGDKVDHATILMSNLRNKAHREKEEIVCKMFSTHAKIDLWFCSSHAKVVAVETACGNHYVIEGSGNHAMNSRVEQYVVDNSEEVFAHTARWMSDIRDFLRAAGHRELAEPGRAPTPGAERTSPGT